MNEPLLPVTLTNLSEKYLYEDLDLCITNVLMNDQVFNVELSVRTAKHYWGEPLDQRWQIEVIGHRQNNVSFDYGESIEILTDHPVLWKYSDFQAELYFSGVCEHPDRLFYQMYQVHYALYQGLVPFEAFLNTNDFGRFFQLPGGLLAKGPRKLLQAYAPFLEEAGLKWSITNERKASYWDGASHQPERDDLQILRIDQTTTYIVAEGFNFTAL
jgi:hypothetical protein